MPADAKADRRRLIAFLQAELVGPAPVGEEIDCRQDIVLGDDVDQYKPRVQLGTREEILQRDPPRRRYGVGVLYPLGVDQETDDLEPEDTVAAEVSPGLLADSASGDLNRVADRQFRELPDQEEDFDLSSANDYKPSAMAITFLAELKEGSNLGVSLSAGRYRAKAVHAGGRDRKWWLRTPILASIAFSAEDLCEEGIVSVPKPVEGVGLDGINLRVEILSRPTATERVRLLTVCLINRTLERRPIDEYTLFQVGFTASVQWGTQRDFILPYPKHPSELLDDEEQSLDLLYRHAMTFAVGHGCAADWGTVASGRTATASAVAMPVVETPNMTSDILTGEGARLEVPMAILAGVTGAEDGFPLLNQVIDLYEAWIARQAVEAQSLDERHRVAALRHMQECTRALTRMSNGLRLLRADPVVAQAFKWANEVVLTQQINGRRAAREAAIDPTSRRVVFSPGYEPPNLSNVPDGVGNWRPFQIAFLLMTLQGLADPAHAERRTVDLLWFPTGGGKTEAYLGLAAFAIFLRRLRDASDVGCEVLMRYTLRLLTAQQFQRAARLVCAMEELRLRNSNLLGEAPFTIGIWLGGSTTPNTREEAVTALRQLQRGRQDAENKFLLDRCPWCKAPIGPVKSQGRAREAALVLGIEQRGRTVVFRCPDPRCRFALGLPVLVIDEDIYDEPPSFLIGTIDKFAVLAWKPDARAIFGLGGSGSRLVSPPSLIIQDELHLISGPLGSMAGLFEALVEGLCTCDTATTVMPKVICSTATVRRYRAQVRSLYKRDDVALFPPPALSSADSFFARWAVEPDGSLSSGRLYVGVHGPGLGSLQTAQVRTLAALLQGPVAYEAQERDPWWTLMMFFNSLRELGGTLSLIQSDIPDYLGVIRRRLGLRWEGVRRLNRVLELTSRLKSEEVPEAIGALEKATTAEGAPVDICLASSMIEVGIDIDRLSLMAVVGQPKSTAQYIQVTGRVGRRWWDRPGLVVTIYAASKARDRSHFEKFRSYHERLYAQVEPASVTPFSRPVLERALHAIMVGYVRQCGTAANAASPRPMPSELLEEFRASLAARAEFIDEAELSTVEEVFDRRLSEWRRWDPRFWSGQNEYEIPLLRPAGSYEDPIRAQRSWPTPNSLRNVDAECQAEISTLYSDSRGGQNG